PPILRRASSATDASGSRRWHRHRHDDERAMSRRGSAVAAEKNTAKTENAKNGSTEASGGENGAGGSGTAAAEPEMSYEEAREERDSVVRRLGAGGLTRKESLSLWERGETLAATCEQWLEGARAKLAVAMEERGQDGSAESEDTPF